MKYTHLILSGAWYLLLLAWGNLSTAQGQNVGAQEAMDIAAHYLSQQHGDRASARGGAQLSIAYTAQEGAETYYHVVSNGEDGGYVIVGGHDAANEILGYVEEGHFDYDSIPPAMRWLLGTYQEQIRTLYADPTAATLSRAQRRNATAARTNVPNFLSTKWNQYAPYNLGITGGSNAYPIGCVNTATAQVMKYYNHPAQATNPYMGSYSLGSVTARSVEANRVLDFGAMYNSYSSSTSYSGSNKAVADLMYLIARLNETEFATDGSSAANYWSGVNMIDYLDYDKTMEYRRRNDYTAAEWDELMYAEMAAKRPVLYGGQDDNYGGHSFVLCGYQNSTYYINWGYSGGSDGYFALNACNVKGYHYNSDQSAITHIAKNANGVPTIQITGYQTDRTQAVQGTLFNTKLSYHCNTIAEVSGYTFRQKLKNVTTGAITELREHMYAKLSNEGEATYQLSDTLPSAFTVGDRYEVLLYYRQGEGAWQEFASTTKPVIEVMPQIDFKSYQLSDTDLARGSSTYLVLTYKKSFVLDALSYRVAARLKNLTLGTDTLVTLKSNFKPYSSKNDQTEKFALTIPGTYRAGDKVQIEMCYRQQGTSTWQYIDQKPIELTLANELDLFSYSIAQDGYLQPAALVPYSITYTCRTKLCNQVDIGIRCQGVDDATDIIAVAKNGLSLPVEKEKVYSLSTNLPSQLKVNQSYRLSMLWRWTGESQWREFPQGNTAEVRILSIFEFHSFAMPKSELQSFAQDSVSFAYSCLANNSAVSFDLGVHMHGVTSGHDTVVVVKTELPSTVGEDMVGKYQFVVPGTLWVGEEVKLWGCYRAAESAWQDIDQEPASFRVLECFEFQSCQCRDTILWIGTPTEVELRFSSLSNTSKMGYNLAFGVHNLTTSMPDTIVYIYKSFDWPSYGIDIRTFTRFDSPLFLNHGDRVELTPLYRQPGAEEWQRIGNATQTVSCQAIKFVSCQLVSEGLSVGGSAEVEIKYRKQQDSYQQTFDLGIRFRNLTQDRDEVLVMAHDFVGEYGSTSDQTTNVTFTVPSWCANGDVCKIEACYRVSGSTTWCYYDSDPIIAGIATDAAFAEYTVVKSGDLYFADSMPCTVDYGCVTSTKPVYKVGIHFQGIDNPTDSVLYISEMTAYKGTHHDELQCYLPTFLRLNKQYRVSVMYRQTEDPTWHSIQGEPATIRILNPVTFHSISHTQTERMAGMKDTITFEYSMVKAGKDFTYNLGARVMGMTSGVDTIVSSTQSYFRGNVGEHLTSTLIYALPHQLHLDEEVKVQLYFSENETNWTPMCDQQISYRVKPCYDFVAWTTSYDSAQIDTKISLKLQYKVLHTNKKPICRLAVRAHNTITQVPDTIVVTDNELVRWGSLSQTYTQTVYFMVPRIYWHNDSIELKCLYMLEGEEQWREVPYDPVKVRVAAPKGGLALIGRPEVSNQGYITTSNFEFRLTVRNYLPTEQTHYIYILVGPDNVYKALWSVVTFPANTTSEIVLNKKNMIYHSLATYETGQDLKMLVKDATSSIYLAYDKDCPTLHLLEPCDVTMDGNIDCDDVDAVAKYLLNQQTYPLSTGSFVAADYNEDGNVTLSDLTRIIGKVETAP